MVMVNEGDYGLEMTNRLSAYFDTDRSCWVIHADFNSDTEYYNILFSESELTIEPK